MPSAESGLFPMCKRAVAPEPHSGSMPSQRSHPAAAPLPVGDTGRTMSSAFAELAELEYRLGDWLAAHASALESLRASQTAGLDQETMASLVRLACIEAGLGRAEDCRRHAAEAIELSRRSASTAIEAMAGEAVGFLELGLDRVDSAIDHLERVAELSARDPEACAPATTWATDLAEAYVRRGDSSPRSARSRGLRAAASPSRRASSARRRCSPATTRTSVSSSVPSRGANGRRSPSKPHAPSSASASASIARAAWRRQAPASRRRATPSSPWAHGPGPCGPGGCWPAGVTSVRGR